MAKRKRIKPPTDYNSVLPIFICGQLMQEALANVVGAKEIAVEMTNRGFYGQITGRKINTEFVAKKARWRIFLNCEGTTIYCRIERNNIVYMQNFSMSNPNLAEQFLKFCEECKMIG